MSAAPSRMTQLYELAQRLYSALPYRFSKAGYAFPPWHYFFELTRRCNLRCRMCQYITWLENTPVREQGEGELSTEEWRNVIDQTHSFCLLTFTGGEPLLRPDFSELAAYACQRARVHVITNATMLNDERARELVEQAPQRFGGRGLNAIGVSIEAPGERHDDIRQMDGAYERAMAGIARVCTHRDEAGKACPRVHVTTVLQSRNVDVLAELPAILKDTGVDVLNLATETRMHELEGLGERNPAAYRPEQVPWPAIGRATLAEALEATIAEANRVGLELRMPRMPIEAVLDYYDPGQPNGGLRLAEFECRNAWNTLHIGRQGNVYPCWLLNAGNVREQPIREIWNNAAMRRFRRACQRGLFPMCPGCCFLEHKHDRDALRGKRCEACADAAEAETNGMLE